MSKLISATHPKLTVGYVQVVGLKMSLGSMHSAWFLTSSICSSAAVANCAYERISRVSAIPRGECLGQMKGANSPIR